MSTVSRQLLLSHCGLSDLFHHYENEDELLDATVRWLGPQTSADWVVAYLVDERTRTIVFNSRYVWLRTGFESDAARSHASSVRGVSWKAGVLGRAAHSKVGIMLDSQSEFESDAKDLSFDFGACQSAAVLPLVVGGQTVAILAMGCRGGGLLPDDLSLLSVIGAVASANLWRQAASRDAGTSSKALQKLVQGLSSAASTFNEFRHKYSGPSDFLRSLVKVPLALIRANGSLILTYDSSTNGLFEGGCFFWNNGDGRPVDSQENLFVELVRVLHPKKQLFVGSDLTDLRVGGALNMIAKEFLFLSCLSVPISLFPDRESILTLFSWSRDSFGKLERSIIELVQQLVEVLAAANEAALTVAYFQRTSVMAHQIAGTTHELRNATVYAARYLSYLLGHLERLGAVPSLTAEMADRLPPIIDDANRLKKQLDLVRHRVEILRQFRRKEEFRLSARTFDLNKLLLEIVEASQTIADQKDIVIEIEPDKGLPHIESDPVLVHECVSNLLQNAIYFTRPKGRVRVGSEYIPSLPGVKGRDQAVGRYAPVNPLPVLIQVFDEGGGIHRSEQKKIFEPFYSTKPKRPSHPTDEVGGTSLIASRTGGQTDDQSGTGLGLFLTKNNVTLLGGKITVESVIPKWSKFTIELPLHLTRKLPHA